MNAVSRSMISFCAGLWISPRMPCESSPPRSAEPSWLDERGQPLAHRVRVEVGRVDQRVDLGGEVAAQPRHRGELHPVGHLVQRHPQPEVGRRDPERPLGLDHVGRDQQQLPGRVGEELELPEHLAGQERQHPAGLQPGRLRPDGLLEPPGRPRPALLQRLHQRGEQPGHPVGVDPHPAGPVDHPGRPGSGPTGCRPVIRSTCAAATSTCSRSDRTAASASLRDTSGPGEINRVAVETARSQSTIPGWLLMRPRYAGRPTRPGHTVTPAGCTVSRPSIRPSSPARTGSIRTSAPGNATAAATCAVRSARRRS